ncbi:DUF6065 family protein [Sinimarinibacterium sp. CAU 1509]|uniref:DUF6065 family protein n=1 Tax=Sinimarinibacterium sp. CAU 1509 TaxID=2562283 RepID=UPI001B7FAF9C|nr:DUF6065 family protein [Sinimarinibacterium sp. CAU 1509]
MSEDSVNDDASTQPVPLSARAIQGTLQLVAYQVNQDPMQLRRAARERAWMEATPDRFANRCLPLVLGSQLGWEILCPVDLAASWTGGPAKEDLTVRFYGRTSGLVGSHFGAGVLTFNPGWLFRTPPGIGLLMTGPTNNPKAVIGPLEGFIETDASHMTATMNWRFAAPGEVFFRRGEPIARILPYPQFFIDAFDGALMRKEQMPADARTEYEGWEVARGEFLAKLAGRDPEALKRGWMRHYMRGEHFVSGEQWPTHQTRFLHGEFVDRRNESTEDPND